MRTVTKTAPEFGAKLQPCAKIHEYFCGLPSEVLINLRITK